MDLCRKSQRRGAGIIPKYHCVQRGDLVTQGQLVAKTGIWRRAGGARLRRARCHRYIANRELPKAALICWTTEQSCKELGGRLVCLSGRRLLASAKYGRRPLP